MNEFGENIKRNIKINGTTKGKKHNYSISNKL